ncbi:PREDICTED: uncharacterized protein LOC107067068 [Polistes dominula]|uniref:Uncharacterized protein LOC107067068 n=1 Tax=Polistes dominula TaxID=743375 RepID=A0ABM1IBZ3_POLDO|nr:PREDICTED: uncharacterized protein LOC107067068 [Polistes dominula]XP_015177728.1 PREDICTED: uncharacterized protein LOC107067068 [Polistes dominula]XP_015177729.1 PREDICTED: uncharacterized protein LOC107067068 [Polistes dominula]XP_015177730.1 PREDICTED: uncharacterized protein LOC107067068 [Polistes dominula]
MKKRMNNTESKNTKNRSNEDKDKNDEKDKDKKTIQRLEQNEDTSNQGFGEWLRSNDGAEMMRLFVIANSLLLFVTMAWPNMKESYYFIRDYFMGEEDDY